MAGASQRLSLLVLWRGSFLCERLLPCGLFGLVALGKAGALTEQGSWGNLPAAAAQAWLLLGYQGLVVLFFGVVAVLSLVRWPVRGQRAAPTATIVALGGAFLPTALALAPSTSAHPILLALSAVLMAGGMAIATWALLTLRRSFGILPEARRFVGHGPYRLLRHPMYLGESLWVWGLLLPVFSIGTLLICVGYGVLQLLRGRSEEAALLAAFPQYQAYRLQTPALLPRIAFPWPSTG